MIAVFRKLQPLLFSMIIALAVFGGLTYSRFETIGSRAVESLVLGAVLWEAVRQLSIILRHRRLGLPAETCQWVIVSRGLGVICLSVWVLGGFQYTGVFDQFSKVTYRELELIGIFLCLAPVFWVELKERDAAGKFFRRGIYALVSGLAILWLMAFAGVTESLSIFAAQAKEQQKNLALSDPLLTRGVVDYTSARVSLAKQAIWGIIPAVCLLWTSLGVTTCRRGWWWFLIGWISSFVVCLGFVFWYFLGGAKNGLLVVPFELEIGLAQGSKLVSVLLLISSWFIPLLLHGESTSTVAVTEWQRHPLRTPEWVIAIVFLALIAVTGQTSLDPKGFPLWYLLPHYQLLFAIPLGLTLWNGRGESLVRAHWGIRAVLAVIMGVLLGNFFESQIREFHLAIFSIDSEIKLEAWIRGWPKFIPFLAAVYLLFFRRWPNHADVVAVARYRVWTRSYLGLIPLWMVTLVVFSQVATVAGCAILLLLH